MDNPGLILKPPKSVAVIGAGGVGSWTAILLALSGVKEIYLFDMDTVSESNLNRLLVPKNQVGIRKPVAVAETIKLFRPDCSILPMGTFSPDIADKINLAMYIHWVIATTDTHASRKAAYRWSVINGIPYIEAAAEGEIGSATGTPAEWATADETNPGYASVPVWVGPCVLGASIAVAHVLHNGRLRDRSLRMGWDQSFNQFVIEDSDVEVISEPIPSTVETRNTRGLTFDDVLNGVGTLQQSELRGGRPLSEILGAANNSAPAPVNIVTETAPASLAYTIVANAGDNQIHSLDENPEQEDPHS